MLNLNYLSSAYLALVEKLEWRIDLTQVSQLLPILADALGKILAIHDTRRYPRVIRSSFQRIVSHYLFFGCLVGTSKCSSADTGSPCINQ